MGFILFIPMNWKAVKPVFALSNSTLILLMLN